MDSNATLSKLNQAAPGKVLESSRFGRSSIFSVWIEAKAVRPVAIAVMKDPALRLDWLENFSVAEIGDALVVTYFLRSTQTKEQLILRSSIAVKSVDERPPLATVRDLWPMATPLEDEAAELFGIRFLTESGQEVGIPHALLTESRGFPLRKGFQMQGEA